MKKEGHPEYDDATVTCVCGATYNIRSTVKKMHVTACSACHPAYTGRATMLDTAGRVEQFRRKYAKKA